MYPEGKSHMMKLSVKPIIYFVILIRNKCMKRDFQYPPPSKTYTLFNYYYTVLNWGQTQLHVDGYFNKYHKLKC